jgi:hypothetical protein
MQAGPPELLESFSGGPKIVPTPVFGATKKSDASAQIFEIIPNL